MLPADPAAPPLDHPGHAPGAERAVDAHFHLWDPGDPGQGWLQAAGFEVLRQRFSVDDLRDAATRGVDGRTLTAGVVVQTTPGLEETRRLLATAAADPLLAGVVGWVDLTGDALAQLDELRAGPGGHLLTGVRHQVQDEPDPAWLLRDDVQRGLRVLSAEGLVFDLLVRAPQRATGADAMRRLPGLRVVLDHAGKPDLRPGASLRARSTWETEVRTLAGVEGAVCKLSGLLSETGGAGWDHAALRDAFEIVLDAFGPHRLAFGSDWPVCLLTSTWREWADLVNGLTSGLSPSERDALYRGTATSTYGLTTTRRTTMTSTSATMEGLR